MSIIIIIISIIIISIIIMMIVYYFYDYPGPRRAVSESAPLHAPVCGGSGQGRL